MGMRAIRRAEGLEEMREEPQLRPDLAVDRPELLGRVDSCKNCELAQRCMWELRKRKRLLGDCDWQLPGPGNPIPGQGGRKPTVQEAVLAYLREHPGRTVRELVMALKLKRNSVDSACVRLEARGVLAARRVREGPWEVKRYAVVGPPSPPILGGV